MDQQIKDLITNEINENEICLFMNCLLYTSDAADED